MFVCVPEPVCQTAAEIRRVTPASPSSAAATMASALLRQTAPSSRVDARAGALDDQQRADQRLGHFLGGDAECSSERCVCAPQSRSAGTSMGPKLSRSIGWTGRS
jgi:hypothetical protein